MDKKYELLANSFLEYKGHTLYQIRALKEFQNDASDAVHIYPGMLGGYIENESCLSHKGTCWVGDCAMVCDGARVDDDALICGYAIATSGSRICGNAIVEDTARIEEEATVQGDAHINDNVTVSGKITISGKTVLLGDMIIRGNRGVVRSYMK